MGGKGGRRSMRETGACERGEGWRKRSPFLRGRNEGWGERTHTSTCERKEAFQRTIPFPPPPLPPLAPPPSPLLSPFPLHLHSPPRTSRKRSACARMRQEASFHHGRTRGRERRHRRLSPVSSTPPVPACTSPSPPSASLSPTVGARLRPLLLSVCVCVCERETGARLGPSLCGDVSRKLGGACLRKIVKERSRKTGQRKKNHTEASSSTSLYSSSNSAPHTHTHTRKGITGTESRLYFFLFLHVG